MLPIERYILNQYKKSAQKRGKTWLLTDEQFIAYLDQECIYCGEKATNTAYRKQYAVTTRSYNGIDRIDSSGDYTPANTVSCCKHCNAAKSDQTLAQFRESEWLQEKLRRK